MVCFFLVLQALVGLRFLHRPFPHMYLLFPSPNPYFSNAHFSIFYLFVPSYYFVALQPSVDQPAAGDGLQPGNEECSQIRDYLFPLRNREFS